MTESSINLHTFNAPVSYSQSAVPLELIRQAKVRQTKAYLRYDSDSRKYGTEMRCSAKFAQDRVKWRGIVVASLEITRLDR